MSDTPTPTPGFEFPQSAQDKVEQSLRELVNPKKEGVRSVRPERVEQFAQRKAVVLDEPAHETRPVQVPQAFGEKYGAKPAEKPTAASMMVKNQESPPTPISTPEGISISLPSKFAYYDFKDLYVKPFRTTHLSKMAKVDATGNMQVLAEVVSSCLQTPAGTKNVAFQLCMADLTAVMYWIRMNSFTQKSIALNYVCRDPKHLAAVEAGQKTEETLTSKVVVHESEIESLDLDNIPDPEQFHLIIEDEGRHLRIDLIPERVKDSIEFLELDDWTDPEVQYLARLACMLDLERALPEVEWTLKLKMDFVGEVLTPDHTTIVHKFADLVDSFGIREIFQCKCRECGASGQVRLTIDARTFLSPAF